MNLDRKHLRLALRLQAACLQNHSAGRYVQFTACVELLRSRWDTLQRGLRLTERAITRGWLSAARQQVADGRYDRGDLGLALRQLSDECTALTQPQRSVIADVRSLCEDLRSLTEDFPKLEWDKSLIRVTTRPITLDGIYLGPFEIRLPITSVGKPGGTPDFCVVALDPQPCARRREILHPHVDDTILCTGEATAPLARALAEGRILDFFQIVDVVLRTYNPDSPYVRLEEWEGQALECQDCGGTIGDGEACVCTRCGGDYCGECSYCCDLCTHSVCRACSAWCRSCDQRFCRAGCMRTCSACAEVLCNGCIDDQGRCESCTDTPAQQGDQQVDDQDHQDHNNDTGGSPAGGCAGQEDPQHDFNNSLHNNHFDQPQSLVTH